MAWEVSWQLYPEREFCLYAPEIFRATIIMPEFMSFCGMKIVERLQPVALPEDEAAATQLMHKPNTSSCGKSSYGETCSPWQENVNGLRYALDPNPMGIERIGVEFSGKEGTLFIETQEEEKCIKFGMEDYAEGYFPQTNYFGNTIGIPKGEMYKCIAAARWTQEDKLVIRCYIIDDYFGNLAITLGFKDEELGLNMTKTAEWFLDEYQGFAGGRKER